MEDAGPRIGAFAAYFEALETALGTLSSEPGAGDSIRRLARSLQLAAEAGGAREIGAGAQAIRRASEAQLAHSVRNFLDRVEELRRDEPSARASILLVEDNETVATATSAYLRQADRTILVAPTAEEAEALLDEHDIDLVVLDLILPDRDGRDLLTRMRRRPETAATPVVVLSARGGSVVRAECIAVGADEFVEKPARPRELRALVAGLLRRARSEPNGAVDPSTGLPSATGLARAFGRVLEAIGETDGPSAIALFEVGGVAQVEERMGRRAADRFLAEAALTIRAALSAHDIVGRWSPDRLVAALPGSSVERASEVARDSVRGLLDMDDPERFGIAAAGLGLRVGIAPVVGGGALSAAVETAEAALEPSPRPHRPQVPEDHPLGLDFKRVLLVEDDAVTATLVHHRLVRDGHEVVVFENGEDALAWALEADFDLAVLDVKVPGMDGFELLERLRAVPGLAAVPIVMLTGMGGEADVIRGLELGADDYILKPFSPSELLARVRRLLLRHHGRGSAEVLRANST